MSILLERLDQAFKESLKGHQEVALSTLRMLRTALKNRQVELRRPLTDTEVQAVIAAQAKQRREAIAEYTKAGRMDLAHKEEEELRFLLSFLPPQLSEAELEAEIDRIIAEVGAASAKDLGKVMKAAMAQLAGRAEGRLVQEIVRRRLGS
ncbi:MAG: GatB/YqeY domain-containing protein [Syntrophobacterales bacterium]|nr:GatB/YqeY domain-containing protein [Syntrophobacterales bacterium]